MGSLSDEEKAMLKKLQDKLKAPDGPAIGKSFSISVDLGDANQVAMARKLGLGDMLGDDDVDGDGDGSGDGDGDGDGDAAPGRKGYFGG